MPQFLLFCTADQFLVLPDSVPEVLPVKVLFVFFAAALRNEQIETGFDICFSEDAAVDVYVCLRCQLLYLDKQADREFLISDLFFDRIGNILSGKVCFGEVYS